jgi:hypothetical protein
MKLPKSWDEVTLEQYAKIKRIQKREETTDTQRIDNLISIVQVILNCSIDEAEQLTIKEMEQINELIKSPVNQKIVKEFKTQGIRFEIELNPNELNAWRHAGVMEAIKDVDANMNSVIFYLAKPFKYRGLRRKYFELTEAQIPEVIKGFSQLPVSMAYPIVVFFFNLLDELTNCFLDYSENELKKINQALTTEKQNLLNDMDGLKLSKT